MRMDRNRTCQNMKKSEKKEFIEGWKFMLWAVIDCITVAAAIISVITAITILLALFGYGIDHLFQWLKFY